MSDRVKRYLPVLKLIRKLGKTTPVTYELKDLAGVPIKGKFYELEVQKVLKADDEHFVVDRILKTKRSNGKIQYLVCLLYTSPSPRD